MLDASKITQILTKVKLDLIFLKNIEWRWRVLKKGDGFLLQLEMFIPCNTTDVISSQRGGKAYISPYAIEDEVVSTAFRLVKSYFEHELREGFKYQISGKDDFIPIYQPHWPVKELAKFYGSDKIAEREDTPWERHERETKIDPFAELQDFAL